MIFVCITCIFCDFLPSLLYVLCCHFGEIKFIIIILRIIIFEDVFATFLPPPRCWIKMNIKAQFHRLQFTTHSWVYWITPAVAFLGSTSASGYCWYIERSWPMSKLPGATSCGLLANCASSPGVTMSEILFWTRGWDDWGCLFSSPERVVFSHGAALCCRSFPLMFVCCLGLVRYSSSLVSPGRWLFPSLICRQLSPLTRLVVEYWCRPAHHVPNVIGLCLSIASSSLV